MISRETLNRWEALAAEAWPPAHVEHAHGWRLGFDKGTTHRANAAIALGWTAEQTLSDAVADIIARYRRYGLPPSIKISPASQPDGLDGFLAEREFVVEGGATVLVGPVSDSGSVAADTVIQSGPTEEWAAVAFAGRASADAAARREIVGRVAPPAGFLLSWRGGEPVGAMAVVARDELVVGSALHVRRDARHNGVARGLLAASGSWAAAHGCFRLLVQVEAGNENARELFARHGLTAAYDYHFRVLHDDKVLAP